MVSCKIIQSVLEVLAEISMPCYNRLQSKYSTASADAFILIQDILSHLNEHLRRQGEAGISSSELGILIKSTFGDAIQRKRHRLKQSGSGEETRVYAYFGLEVLDSATFEPPAKVQHSEVGDTTYEHSITDQQQHRIKELEKQLRTETKAKHQLEEKLATETEARNQLEKDFAESPFQWHTVGKVFKQELDALYQAGGPFTDGPSTHKLLHDFSISMLSDQLSKHSPHLHAIISTLNCPHDDSAQAHAIHNIRGITALSIIARRRSNKMKGLQLLVSLMLTARAVSRQVITSLNHLGICLSYHQTMEWVKRLARETARDSTLKEGHWIVVFDNVNFQKRVRHERQHRHTE